MAAFVFFSVVLIILIMIGLVIYNSIFVLAAPDYLLIEKLGGPIEGSAVDYTPGLKIIPWPIYRGTKIPGSEQRLNISLEKATTIDGFEVKQDGALGWRLMSYEDVRSGSIAPLTAQPVPDEESARQFVYQFHGSLTRVDDYLTILYKSAVEETMGNSTAERIITLKPRLRFMVQNVMNNVLWNERGFRIVITFVAFEDLTPSGYAERLAENRSAQLAIQKTTAQAQGLAQSWQILEAGIGHLPARMMAFAKQTILGDGAKTNYNLYGNSLMDAVGSLFNMVPPPRVRRNRRNRQEGGDQ